MKPKITSTECLILLCDIEKYSQLELEDQVQALEILWGKAQILQNALLKSSDLWGTGDGFYLVNFDLSFANILLEWSVNLADSLKKAGLPVRFALHVGEVECCNHISLGMPLKIGHGLNMASRIVSYPDPYQIAVSAQYESRLDPKLLPSKPHRVFVKHGEEILFKLIPGSISKPLNDTNSIKEEINKDIRILAELISGSQTTKPRVRIRVFEKSKHKYNLKPGLRSLPVGFPSTLRKDLWFVTKNENKPSPADSSEIKSILFRSDRTESPNTKTKWKTKLNLDPKIFFKTFKGKRAYVFIPIDDRERFVLLLELEGVNGIQYTKEYLHSAGAKIQKASKESKLSYMLTSYFNR